MSIMNAIFVFFRKYGSTSARDCSYLSGSEKSDCVCKVSLNGKTKDFWNRGDVYEALSSVAICNPGSPGLRFLDASRNPVNWIILLIHLNPAVHRKNLSSIPFEVQPAAQVHHPTVAATLSPPRPRFCKQPLLLRLDAMRYPFTNATFCGSQARRSFCMSNADTARPSTNGCGRPPSSLAPPHCPLPPPPP